jgi:K+-sensing histidine kinase KdpD
MKTIMRRHAEMAVVIMSVAIFVTVKLVFENKFAFLNLYYLPVLLAGYYLGKRPAIMSSVLGVLLTVFFAVSWPTELLKESAGWLNLGLDLLVWSSFLMLVAILVSTLNESRQRRLAAATQELLRKYVQRSIEGQGSHTKRVSSLAVAIARQMRLPVSAVKQIEAAALLHDLGESELAIELLNFEPAAKMDEAQALIAAAVPLVLDGHEYRASNVNGKNVSLGAKVVAIADLFDEISENYQGLQPWWESLEQIQRKGRFDSAVLAALKKALSKQIQQDPLPSN